MLIAACTCGRWTLKVTAPLEPNTMQKLPSKFIIPHLTITWERALVGGLGHIPPDAHDVKEAPRGVK